MYFGGTVTTQMHMVDLNIHCHHFDPIFLTAQSINLLRHIFGYFVLPYFVTLFGAEHHMILALIQRMR